MLVASDFSPDFAGWLSSIKLTVKSGACYRQFCNVVEGLPTRTGRLSGAAPGRVLVATNVGFVDAKRVAPRVGRPTASGKIERQQWVESTR